MRKDDLEDDLDGYFTWQELALVNKQEKPGNCLVSSSSPVSLALVFIHPWGCLECIWIFL